MPARLTLVTPANAPALAAHEASELRALYVKREGQREKLEQLEAEIARREAAARAPVGGAA